MTQLWRLRCDVINYRNRVRQAPCGTWYFEFNFGGENYRQSHFDTQEQVEQALQLQYKVLNLTSTGQKRGKLKSERKKNELCTVECNIFLMYNGKYKVCLTTPKIVKTLDTLEQARAFRDQHKAPRKRHVMTKHREPRQSKPAIASRFTDKTERARQAVMSKNALNKSIAELNNATRVFVEKATPTIAELSRLAKQQANSRQYYIEQLKAGAYRV